MNTTCTQKKQNITGEEQVDSDVYIEKGVKRRLLFEGHEKRSSSKFESGTVWLVKLLEMALFWVHSPKKR